MHRRNLLGRGLAVCGWVVAANPGLAAQAPQGPMQRRVLAFPRDHGSHPQQAIEWWYLTGWLAAGEGDPAWGFQLTFFRTRGPAESTHTSRFAASQVLMAHAALTELGEARSVGGTSTSGRLSHDQRIARVGLGLAHASEADTAVLLNVAGRPWRLSREAGANGSRYRASFDLALGREAGAARVGLTLDLAASQPPLLQGQAGWSRKGPAPDQASFYVSEPQLAVTGELLRGGKTTAVRGRAWLDHEWSDQMLPPQAQGWDWLGINLFDGSALTLFRLRRKSGTSAESAAVSDAAAITWPGSPPDKPSARVGAEGLPGAASGTTAVALWAGGSWRGALGPSRSFTPQEVAFEPLRRWISPTSAASYPVEWRLHTPVGRYVLRALADAQELDARASTGTVYWEGLAELLDAASGQRIGLGYLEMTGYAGRPAL
jgi:predicted secreted hydrolase